MKLNQWYEVTATFQDPVGYMLIEGSYIRPTSVKDYPYVDYSGGPSRAVKLQHVTLFSLQKDARLNKNFSILPRTLEELEKVLQPVEDDSPITKLIEESKKDFPQSHCDLEATMTIGSDPEVFVVNKTGTLVPAFDFLPSEKEAIWDSSPYWDGFQAEFKVNPATCHVVLTNNIRSKLVALHQKAKKHLKDSSLVGAPTMLVPKNVMDKASEEHVALGCAPSKNAYGHKGQVVSEGRDFPIRFAGFHIHHATKVYSGAVGTTLYKDPVRLVKSMDNIGGVLSVSLLEGLEDPIRRQYYGLAGEYRTPSHGLEYRVISSAALWHPALSYIHLDFVRAGCQLAMHGLDTLWEGSEDETTHIINELDVDGARVALRRNQRLMQGLLGRYYPTFPLPPHYFERIFDGLLMKGIRDFIELDMTKNWGLTSTSFNPQMMASLCAQEFKAKTMVAMG
ncbi:MAG: hypothetical protein KGI27_10145 [Thaumarchaeota archaeon]|nr:hypothetical protein [Nitrososphaerota archaeon]